MVAAQVMGRDGELEILTSLARDAASGRGRLVLIEGEPGIGKTSLLRALLEDAADLLPRVVTGAAEEFDQRLPFATAGSCLEPLAAGDQEVAEVLALIRGTGAEYPVIESVQTKRVAAGHTLWELSRNYYGDPTHYPVIYEANKWEIHNPNLIYPGEVFVVPKFEPKP